MHAASQATCHVHPGQQDAVELFFFVWCDPAALPTQASRQRILAAEADPSEMHSLLTNLPPLGALSADELSQAAVAIYRRCPPKQLLRKHQMRLVTCARTLHFPLLLLPFTQLCFASMRPEAGSILKIVACNVAIMQTHAQTAVST